MKIVYLLRHAKAEPSMRQQSDSDRPLALRGREACIVMGARMKALHYQPVLALVSTALRTSETLTRVMQEAGQMPAVRQVRKLYLATAGEMLEMIQQVANHTASVMLVGHNPGMHHLALLLAKPEETDHRRTLEIKYPTGSLTVLGFEVQSWEQVLPGEGEILDFITPDD